MGQAQRLLTAELLNEVKTTPGGRLSKEKWRALTDEQRQMIVRLREYGQDGWGTGAVAPEPRGNEAMNGERPKPTPFAGRDPLTQVRAAGPNPNPKTGLDPESMHEIFGGVVDTAGLDQFEGDGLLDELRRRFFAKHVVLDYRAAREQMFGKIDNEGGVVWSVYGGKKLEGVRGVPKADGPNGFNTEHTWPQSKLKAAGKHEAISDLHHLFPTDSETNGIRGNYPFGWVRNVQWSDHGSQLGTDDKGQLVFTPHERHRGDVARSMFWVAAAYDLKIPDDEEATLKEWDKQDPVDQKERTRNERIAKAQGDENPFVLMPNLTDKVQDF